MVDYKSSIKCKYCCYYGQATGLCKYHDAYTKEVSPNSRCSHFWLDDSELMVNSMISEQGGILPRRKDGSYIATIDDVPELKAKYEEQHWQAEQKRAEEEKKHKTRITLLCVVLGIGWLVFFWPFLEMLFGILSFLF